MKLYKKQIMPVAYECAWQGFNSTYIPLEDWIDVKTNEKDMEKELTKKWTDEKMYEITHDRMRILNFEYRFVEYTGIVIDEFINKAEGI